MKTIIAIHLYVICLLFPNLGNAQLIQFTGNIINENNGNPIENVSIFESFSGIGTITNINGFFSLILQKGTAEIVISKDGFKNFSQKIVLKADTTINVSLVPVMNIKSKAKETEPQKTANKIEMARKR